MYCLLTVSTLLNCSPAYVRTLLNCSPAYVCILLNCSPAYIRTVSIALPADLRTCNPSVPAYRRTWNASFLCMYALFFHCTYVPLGIDDFKTSEITQTNRSTDLNMRRRDLNPSVDSPYLDLDILPRDHNISDLALIRCSTQNMHKPNDLLCFI